MQDLKLWPSIRPQPSYPGGAPNVTGTTIGAKHAMDVNILSSGSGAPALSQITDSGGVTIVGITDVAGDKSLNVVVKDISLDYIGDSISLGANGAFVSDANPLPIKWQPITTANATATDKAATYTEVAGALQITIICTGGSCSLPGGRVLSAGQSMNFQVPTGYKFGAFTVTFISGSYTISVVR